MRPDGFASNGDGFHPSKLKFEIKQLEINADLAKDGRDKEYPYHSYSGKFPRVHCYAAYYYIWVLLHECE